MEEFAAKIESILKKMYNVEKYKTLKMFHYKKKSFKGKIIIKTENKKKVGGN